MAGLAYEQVGPARGVTYVKPPHAMEPLEAATLNNFIPGESGRLRSRGRVGVQTRFFTSGSPAPCEGIWTFNDNTLMTNLAHSTTLAYLGTGYTGSSNAAVSSFTPSDLPKTTRFTRVDDFVYGPGGTGAVASSNRKLLQWNGSTTLTSQTTAAPRGFVDVKSYARQLFVLGGSVPGTTTPFLRKSLFWTDLGGPTSDTLVQWQDDVSGLTNRLDLTIEDNDETMGLASIAGRSLLVFCRSSIYVLNGTNPDAWVLRKVSSAHGCIDTESILEADDGCYFLSHSGYMFTDGITVTNISEPILTRLFVGLNGVFNGRTAAFLPGGYIYIVGLLSPGAFLGHITTRTWAGVTADDHIWPAGAQFQVVSTTNFVLGWDGKYMSVMNELAIPGVTVTGTDRDFDGNQWEIPIDWISRTIHLGGPFHRARLTKVIVDYKWIPSTTSVIDEHEAFGIGLLDETGFVSTDMGTQYPLTQAYDPFDPVDNPSGRRAVYDVFTEVESVQVNIGPIFSGPVSIDTAEIYAVYIVYEPAQPSYTF